ncbi:MAG: NYN domain-containing protein [Candidatus Hydrogenedentes bacterium]|nr:NYN domain-containing protein [Candidatus Hydrogenedentota bacterium]
MQFAYYIDGYNVIHHCRVLGPLARRDFESARDVFIEQVHGFSTVTGHLTRVVFDGRGAWAEAHPNKVNTVGLEVIFTPRRQSADAFIERTVYTATHRNEIIVVSGDRGIRDFCHRLGTLVMGPDNFLATIQDAQTQFRASLRHHHRVTRRERIEDRVDESTLARLRELRQKLAEQPGAVQRKKGL